MKTYQLHYQTRRERFASKGSALPSPTYLRPPKRGLRVGGRGFALVHRSASARGRAGRYKATPVSPPSLSWGLIAVLRKRLVVIVLIAFFILPSIASGASEEALRSLTAKLSSWDVEEAWKEVKGYLPKEPKDPELLELASHIAFHRGQYREALELITSAIELGKEDDGRKSYALFMEQTIEATTPFTEHESIHFVIRLDEKQDGILANYMTETLEATYRAMAQHYGFRPEEKIRVEVFPDSKAFYHASSLSSRDIEIGAVGLAKFNKLMVLSPRALVRGYRWLDAVSHEYMHYLILKLSRNKAPIWFHEGLAKYEETRWRNGPSYLSSLYQNLLVRAITDQKFIPFEKMEPSLVKLETPEEVQLAYAEAASAIEFIIAKAGHEGLQRIMKYMAVNNKGAIDSIREVLGLSFEEFDISWKDFLRSKGLKEVSGVNAWRYKIKEGKADEERMEMEEIKSIVSRNRAHLGDRLRERGRTGAALSEYRRALADAPDSVSLLTRLSSCLRDLDRDEEALEYLKRAKEVSEDHPSPYADLGEVYLKRKDFKKSMEAFEESIQINPFNPRVHQGLARAYEALGEKAASLRELEVVRKLNR